MTDYSYIGVHRLVYGEDDEFGGASFIPRCMKCGRAVKADKKISFNGEGQPAKQPNATCSRCGRIEMIFEGYA